MRPEDVLKLPSMPASGPVADFPVRRVVAAHHFIADLTLPYGRVLYDYVKEHAPIAAQTVLAAAE